MDISTGPIPDQSPDLQMMREARNSPAVHKINLATIRAHNSDCVVFVCEGVDDKKVYFHWLRIINPSLDYEFQICNGKGKLLDFREMLRRDASGLNENVYFIIDHDFDGLRSYPEGPDIYVSETYSFENWLVSTEVLDSILCVELHCHGEASLRDKVTSEFNKLYDKFLEITRPHNERIFLARRLGIDTKPLPTRLAKLAEVTLTEVNPQQEPAHSVICLEREPCADEIEQRKQEFDELDPKNSYRGKFALLFFLRWLEMLGHDRNSDESIFFKDASRSAAKANGQIQLSALAAKSLPPPSFRSFVESIRITHDSDAPSHANA
ncbi:DUF4435 domain-containing protein [Achromobacter mucicolens]|uniref:DUF4435 domain-containing protein n=1 Tax=Achromobacter mucicolens TaxID=1389922 RepID=UPI003D104A21